MNDLYCPMIHGGININFKSHDGSLGINQCCLSSTPLIPIDKKDIWDNKNFLRLREINDQNQWNPDCWECKQIEAGGLKSFRKSMLQHFGEKRELTGPIRIDLLFDRSCNLACTICNSQSSTFWQQYEKQNNFDTRIFLNISKVDQVIETLKTLDLSNLEQVQFCGGETLMGTAYWKVAKVLSEIVPNADKKLLVGFQTNGTQTIDKKYYEIIEKFHLVKLFISIDGIDKKFNYLRWPGEWNQVSENILELRENLPFNVMFLVQEALSNFNLFYADEVATWISNHFATNRVNDKVEHAQQLANHDLLGIDNITEEYVAAISNRNTRNMLPANWKENPDKIRKMLAETAKHDQARGQNWKRAFPEIVKYYSRYLQ
jgi:hypothetical protein